MTTKLHKYITRNYSLLEQKLPLKFSETVTKLSLMQN